ncbi:MAG: hypothetical protein AAFO07_03150 [Bacteroidota bacterium]
MQFIEATAIQDKDGNFQIEMPEDMDLTQVMFVVVMDEEEDEDLEDSSGEDAQIYAMRASELFAMLSGEDDDDNEIIPTASGAEC